MRRRVVLPALLLLLAILGWPAAGRTVTPPPWLPGRYATFDPWSNRNVRLIVRQDGRAYLRITDPRGVYIGRKVGGYAGNGRIVLSNEWYSAHRVGNNVRLTYLSGHHHSWLFYRQ